MCDVCGAPYIVHGTRETKQIARLVAAEAEVARLTPLGDALAAAVEAFSRFRIPEEWGDEWDAIVDAARAWRARRGSGG